MTGPEEKRNSCFSSASMENSRLQVAANPIYKFDWFTMFHFLRGNTA